MNGYKIKDKKIIKEILKEQGIKTQRNLAEIIGINEDYLSQIINGRPTIKLTSYAITKAISSNAEIENFFEKV